MSKHTLSVLVEDKPGVLTRVAALFSRRGFNINSLAVGPTELPDISRITVVVEVEGAALEQVTKQLNKLIEVLKVVELDPHASVQREISGSSVGPTASELMLKPRREKSAATRVRTPGLSSTSTDRVCLLMVSPPAPRPAPRGGRPGSCRC